MKARDYIIGGIMFVAGGATGAAVKGASAQRAADIRTVRVMSHKGYFDSMEAKADPIRPDGFKEERLAEPVKSGTYRDWLERQGNKREKK